jgi:hypothetical protein
MSTWRDRDSSESLHFNPLLFLSSSFCSILIAWFHQLFVEETSFSLVSLIVGNIFISIITHYSHQQPTSQFAFCWWHVWYPIHPFTKHIMFQKELTGFLYRLFCFGVAKIFMMCLLTSFNLARNVYYW